MTDELKPLADIIEFLQGSAPLEDVWFGQHHPDERGLYWWRSRLTAALAACRRESPGEAKIDPRGDHDAIAHAELVKAARLALEALVDVDRFAVGLISALMPIGDPENNSMGAQLRAAIAALRAALPPEVPK